MRFSSLHLATPAERLHSLPKSESQNQLFSCQASNRASSRAHATSRGAAEGAGLGNAFLSHIQAVDGIFHVVRAFDSEEVIHVDDSVDPVRDLETIQHELCAKDMEYLKRAVDQVGVLHSYFAFSFGREHCTAFFFT